MANASDRKKKILAHVAQSKNELPKPLQEAISDDRKRQIMDHLRRTRSQI